MSTRGSISGVHTTETVGDEKFHQSLHFFQDCNDDDGRVYLEMFQQGVFGNVTQEFMLPRAEAIAFFSELGKWAEQQKE